MYYLLEYLLEKLLNKLNKNNNFFQKFQLLNSKSKIIKRKKKEIKIKK